MKYRYSLLVLFIVLSVPESNAQDRVSMPVDSGWRFAAGNLQDAEHTDFDDSGWDAIGIPGRLNLSGAGQYFWLRADLTIPESLQGRPVWFETGKAVCAFDLYADGIYCGTRGGMPPDYFARPQQNNAILLPSNVIEDGHVVIALRAYYNGSETFLPGFNLVNAAQATFITHFQNLFNMRVYIILSFICLFLGSYFIAQFIARPNDRASLFYALSLIFIATYFYDMGSERTLIDGLVQRAVGRASLSASLGFLMLFLMKFFGAPGYRLVRAVVAVDIIGFGIAFMLNLADDSAINTVFNLSLLPVFGVIIFGVLIVIKAARRHERDAWPILIGLLAGVGFGIHDIVYQVSGKDPFAWLQGFTFFSLNLSVFIAMSSRAARAQKDLDVYIRQTAEQRDRLTELVSSAETLAGETSRVAKALDEAVSGVAEAAARSANEAGAIGSSVERQNRTLAAASEAVEGLIASIRSVNAELETEAESIAKTAGETGSLIEGFSLVGEGIEGAAAFSAGLDSLTLGGRRDMELLASAMERVKTSSSEILGVVDAVNDFAERTNLLAMNASIEAAHAGIAGRGFGVIAQEIKKLASASAERASRIGVIASGIDGAVSEGFNLSLQVKNSLDKVAEGAAETASRVRDASMRMSGQRSAGTRIAAESEALAASASRMREEAIRQSSFSERVSGNMSELAAVATDVGRAAADIVARNTELASQSEALTKLAARARETAESVARLMAR
ncbi:MAG: hypothetical protein E4H20_06065 [Spirochaetales bacterium]|nr:MAG: hypothetical protein E4H20_06065 [Spirochaetales bacterium]